jgi:hypothetical protein
MLRNVIRHILRQISRRIIESRRKTVENAAKRKETTAHHGWSKFPKLMLAPSWFL